MIESCFEQSNYKTIPGKNWANVNTNWIRWHQETTMTFIRSANNVMFMLENVIS